MSGIATGTAIAIAGGIGAAGSIAGGAISANAAGNAASAQSNAANYAAQLQYQASQNALGFQENQWQTAQNEMMPFLQSGYGALGNLDYLMGIGSPNGQGGGAGAPGGNIPNGTGVGGPSPNGGPVMSGARPVSELQHGVDAHGNPIGPVTIQRTGAPGTAPGPNTALGGFGSLMQGYGQTFQAPTAQQMEQNDPGYQARMQLGEQALQQSAAARGNLLTGGTGQALNQFAQDYASNEYNNYYNQAYNQYAQNYNQWSQQQARQYNQLASMAGLGQTAAGQLGTLGQSAANGISNNLLGTAAGMGQAYQNAAAANASGMVGSANAWNGALGGLGGNISQLMLLNQLYGGGGGGNANYVGGSIPTNELDALG